MSQLGLKRQQIEALIGAHPDTDIIYELAAEILGENERDSLDLKVLSRLINIKEDQNRTGPYVSCLREYLGEIQHLFRNDDALLKDAYILQRWDVSVDPDPEINRLEENVLLSIINDKSHPVICLRNHRFFLIS